MPVSTAPKTVLIIDDEPSIVDLLTDILKSANYRPIGAVKWTDAVDAIGHESPSLILLDLKMPTIDGPPLLEFIWNEGVQIPVIIVSGFITDEVSDDLKQLDVEAFVQKPFRATDILAHVERVIGSASEPAEEDAATNQPPSMATFLTSSDSDKTKPESALPKKEDEADVLAALTKLGPKEPGTGHTPDRDISSRRRRLRRTQCAKAARYRGSTRPRERLSTPGAAAPAPGPPSEAAPPTVTPPSQETPPAPPLPRQRNRHKQRRPPQLHRPPEAGFADAMVGSSPQPERIRERRDHHHHVPRRRRFTRRNVMLFGSLFLTCVAVASFMALMRWYAGQVDIVEIQKKATESIRKEATQELLKELQK